MGVIYKITCKENNKSYIGVASIDFNERKTKHLSLLKRNKHGNEYMQNSFNKYGLNSFTFKKLKEGINSLPELARWECYYIGKFDTYKKGFNKTIGGDFPPSFTGKKHSEETKKKISEAHKGKKRTEETKEKLRETHSRIRGKPVYQYNLDGNFIKKYRSRREAERQTGVPATNIGNCANPKHPYKTAGNYRWFNTKQKNLKPIKSAKKRMKQTKRS